MTVNLRQATRADVAGMHRVRLAVRENRLVSMVIGERDYIDAIEIHGRGWVIEAGGEIVAFAVGNRETGNIWALFVDPEHERHGHGRALLEAMVEWLWEQGLTRLWLSTDPNTRAARFYEIAGWGRCGSTSSGEALYELDRTDAGKRMDVRHAEGNELPLVAKLWHDVWHSSHAGLMPDALTRLRTLESFEDRVRAMSASLRVAGPRGAPAGFCIVKGDELHQLFVQPQSMGSGIAAALLADAERRLSESGVTTAWLACAIGNERAARFYEKHGWRRVGPVSYEAETSAGTFTLDVWRYEKALPGPASFGS